MAYHSTMRAVHFGYAPANQFLILVGEVSGISSGVTRSGGNYAMIHVTAINQSENLRNFFGQPACDFPDQEYARVTFSAFDKVAINALNMHLHGTQFEDRHVSSHGDQVIIIGNNPTASKYTSANGNTYYNYQLNLLYVTRTDVQQTVQPLWRVNFDNGTQNVLTFMRGTVSNSPRALKTTTGVDYSDMWLQFDSDNMIYNGLSLASNSNQLSRHDQYTPYQVEILGWNWMADKLLGTNAQKGDTYDVLGLVAPLYVGNNYEPRVACYANWVDLVQSQADVQQKQADLTIDPFAKNDHVLNFAEDDLN